MKYDKSSALRLLSLSNDSKIKDNFQKSISFANEHYKWKKILEPVKNWAEEKWRIMDKKSRK